MFCFCLLFAVSFLLCEGMGIADPCITFGKWDGSLELAGGQQEGGGADGRHLPGKTTWSPMVGHVNCYSYEEVCWFRVM